MDFVSALALSRGFEADACGSSGAVELAVVNGARAAGIVGAVVADVASGEAVELIDAVEVHPADLDGVVSGGTEGVGVSWDGR